MSSCESTSLRVGQSDQRVQCGQGSSLTLDFVAQLVPARTYASEILDIIAQSLQIAAI